MRGERERWKISDKTRKGCEKVVKHKKAEEKMFKNYIKRRKMKGIFREKYTRLSTRFSCQN